MTPQETAQAVLREIRENPAAHEQACWDSSAVRYEHVFDPPCQTTRCVGGWALYVNGYSIQQLQTAYGNGTGPFYVDLARELLGLSGEDAEKLFYDADNDEAVRALEYLARGEEINWEKTWGGPLSEAVASQ